MKPKKANTNGVPANKREPSWKRHVDDYRTDELSRVNFATVDDIDAAIGIVWGGKLHGMPFQLGGDGRSLVVPKAGLPYFVDAGLNFAQKGVTLR